MIHELKIKPEYFAAVVSGDKTFEIRNNADRNFQVGDTLLLWEWNGGFTGQTAERTVSYITDFEQKTGYVVLGLANKCEQELAEQLADATRQCGVMAELLREARNPLITAMEVSSEDESAAVEELIDSIDSMLAGKLPDRQDTEWTDSSTSPVAADYRELQELHDQLQSKYKAAMDIVRDLVDIPYSTGGLIERLEVRERARDLLAGHEPDPAEQEGKRLIYIGEIEVSHKWWLNCKSEFFSPIDGADFSDWPDGINKLFRIAASPGQQGGEPCAIEPRSSSQA